MAQVIAPRVVLQRHVHRGSEFFFAKEVVSVFGSGISGQLAKGQGYAARHMRRSRWGCQAESSECLAPECHARWHATDKGGEAYDGAGAVSSVPVAAICVWL